jgi:hypothetical protein
MKLEYFLTQKRGKKKKTQNQLKTKCKARYYKILRGKHRKGSEKLVCCGTV